MPKHKGVSPKTKRAIKGYVKKGYSTNKIQKTLQARGLGIRRKVLLTEIRKVKGVQLKKDSQKYTRKKYRERKERREKWTERARITAIPQPKQVAVYGYATTPRYREIAKELEASNAYSARFEFHGRGKDIGDAVRLAYKGIGLYGIVPRFEEPFVNCRASAFLNNPYRFGERGKWVDKPEIRS